MWLSCRDGKSGGDAQVVGDRAQSFTSFPSFIHTSDDGVRESEQRLIVPETAILHKVR